VDALLSSAADRVAGLTAAYDALDAAIASRLEATAVYITAYPDPGSGYDPDGEERFPLCREIAGDLVFGLEVDDGELALANERVAAPLADAMAGAAAEHGWVLVDAHVEDFLGHGYCGAEPYDAADYPGNPWPDPVEFDDVPGVRWFRRGPEAAAIQGDAEGTRFAPERLATEGTLHPNQLGHQAIAAALLDAFAGG
jgi:hypothetical protein